MSEITAYSLNPIGFIRSSLKIREDAPKQGFEGASDAWLDVTAGVAEGLQGIAAGQEIILITWLHRASRDVLKTHPRSDLTLPLTGISNPCFQNPPTPE
jgi:tRNA (Thr-GGU) A37 N-methylase